MDRNFLDGNFRCSAEDFFQLLEEWNYDLRDTSKSKCGRAKIIVSGDIEFPVEVDQPLYLEDVVFKDSLNIENATFQSGIHFQRCILKGSFNITNTRFREHLRLIYCKMYELCVFADLEIGKEISMIGNHFDFSCQSQNIRAQKYYSTGCFEEGFKVGRLPLSWKPYVFN